MDKNTKLVNTLVPEALAIVNCLGLDPSALAATIRQITAVMAVAGDMFQLHHEHPRYVPALEVKPCKEGHWHATLKIHDVNVPEAPSILRDHDGHGNDIFEAFSDLAGNIALWEMDKLIAARSPDRVDAFTMLAAMITARSRG